MSKEYLEAAWRESRSWDSDLHETKCFQEAIERLEKAEAKLDEIAEYAEHKTGCNSIYRWSDTGMPTRIGGDCDCGLNAIINREKP